MLKVTSPIRFEDYRDLFDGTLHLKELAKDTHVFDSKKHEEMTMKILDHMETMRHITSRQAATLAVSTAFFTARALTQKGK